MATKRTSFGKLERDRAKAAKGAAKRERRQSRTDETDADSGQAADDGPVERVSVGDQLQKIEAVHQRFEAGLISFEDFEAQKSELLSHLSVD